MYTGAVRCRICLGLVLLGSCSAGQPDPSGEARASYDLGMARFREGRFGEARPLFEKAAALAPDSQDTWKALGLTLLRLNDYAAAVDPLRHACEKERGGEDACYLEGRTLFLLARYDEAVAPLEKAQRNATSADQAKVDRALALNADKLGNFGDAERWFLAAISHNGGVAEDPRVDYGAFLVRQGRAGEAVEPLKKALAARPDSAAVNAELGRALLDLDRPGEALPYLEKAVSINPQAWTVRMLLGKAYLRIGRSEEGQRELERGRDGWAKADHGSSKVR